MNFVKLAIITDTLAPVAIPSLEYITPAVSVRKPKKNVDTYSIARPWMQITIDLTQMWRLPEDFWKAMEKGLQHLSPDTQ
jgi:hypothetical protein